MKNVNIKYWERYLIWKYIGKNIRAILDVIKYVSDFWKPYDSIESLPEGYQHKKVNHSKEYKAADGTCTNTIEGSWRHVKRSLPLNVRKGDYSGHLAEFLWRKLNRENDLFMQFFLDVGDVFVPKHRDWMYRYR